MEAELAFRHEREIQEGDAFFLPESRFQRTGLAHPLRGRASSVSTVSWADAGMAHRMISRKRKIALMAPGPRG